MMRSRLVRIIMVVTIAVTVLSLLLSVLFVPKQGESVAPAKPAQNNTAAADLGVTYLPLTPSVAEYYHLGVESGAMITQITSNSLADKAGLKVGDVIMTYNGIPVEKEKSLLSLVRDCPTGANILIEVHREMKNRTFNFVHTQN